MNSQGTGKIRFVCIAGPALFRAEVEVSCAGALVDRAITAFGIREIKVDAEHGLRINGESYKLKGACVHHDNGPPGSAAIDRAEERRVELLKANGYNAIRCSHNPPSSVFLDACDRLGIMVIDEAFDMWEQQKNPDDYHLDFKEWWKSDIDAMVLRDRNHPSVIMWSIGNEISERSDPDGVWSAKALSTRIRELDTSRPVTRAVPFFFDARKPRPWSDIYDELRSCTWPGNEGVAVTVRVYSKSEKVNLTLNGKPIEVAKAESSAPFVTEFALPYAPGELKASPIVNGKLVEQVLRTTGNPSRIALRADRAHIRTSRNDLSYVMAELQDEADNPIEDGVAEIQFTVKGPGELAAVGSANPREMASYHLPHRMTFHGRCVAILRPTGEKGAITLEARGDNLRPGNVSINVT